MILFAAAQLGRTYATSASPFADLYPSLYATIPEEFVPMEDRTIYLTFDDGPSENTIRILDILKEEGVKATFFVIGKDDEASRAIIKRAHDEGHTIGMHCNVHSYPKLYGSVEGYLKDLNAIHEFVYSITGEYPLVMRFPGGSANRMAPNKSIFKQIVEEVGARGFVYYDWNIVTGDDTSEALPVAKLYSNIKKGLDKNSSAMILCHDAPMYTTTPDTIQKIIKEYKAEGYSFAAIQPGLKPIQFARMKNKT